MTQVLNGMVIGASSIRDRHRWHVRKVPKPAWDGTELCSSLPVEVADYYFYPEFDEDPGGSLTKQAYARGRELYCDGCPFKAPCAEYAIAHEPEGLWGGLTPNQRADIRRKRRQFIAQPDTLDTVFSAANMAQHNMTLAEVQDDETAA